LVGFEKHYYPNKVTTCQDFPIYTHTKRSITGYIWT